MTRPDVCSAVRSKLSCFVMVILCGCMSSAPDVAMELRLAATIDDRTNAAITRILHDILEHKYKTGPVERLEAFRAIARTNAKSLLPEVRRVARLTISRDEARVYSDTVAVGEALYTLVTLEDPLAVELIVPWLASDRLRGVAALQLSTLNAWGATEVAARELLRMPMREANASEVATLLAFLSRAPTLAPDACTANERAQSVYAQCFVASVNEHSFCGPLATASVELTGRCRGR